jgi:hypothetical protein
MWIDILSDVFPLQNGSEKRRCFIALTFKSHFGGRHFEVAEKRD